MFKDQLFFFNIVLINVFSRNLAVKLCDTYKVTLVGIRVKNFPGPFEIQGLF